VLTPELKQIKEKLLRAAGTRQEVERACVETMLGEGLKEYHGGIVRYVLRKHMLAVAPELVSVAPQQKWMFMGLLTAGGADVLDEAVKELGFTENWVPAGPVLQEALALLVKVRNVLLPVTGGAVYRRDAIVEKLLKRVAYLDTPDQVFAMGLDQVLELGKVVEDVK